MWTKLGELNNMRMCQLVVNLNNDLELLCVCVQSVAGASWS